MYSGQKYLVHPDYRPSDSRTRSDQSIEVSGGFPHSDIPGSKGALASPGLIAECHVLHRLLLPRHPPNALFALDPIQKKTGPFACGWFKPQPVLGLWSEVIDPGAAPRQRHGAGRELRTALAGQTEPHGQCLRLGKTVCRPPRDLPRTESSPAPRGPPAPHSGTDPKTSRVFALFTMSDPDRMLAIVAIGQEGHHDRHRTRRRSCQSGSNSIDRCLCNRALPAELRPCAEIGGSRRS